MSASDEYMEKMVERSIEQAIEDLLNHGQTQKDLIIQNVAKRFQVQRKVVIGIAEKLRVKMCKKLKILQNVDIGLCSDVDLNAS